MAEKNACDKGMQFVQQGMSNKSSALESFKAARKKKSPLINVILNVKTTKSPFVVFSRAEIRKKAAV